MCMYNTAKRKNESSKRIYCNMRSSSAAVIKSLIDINIRQVYVPIPDGEEETGDNFYKDLNTVMVQRKNN